MLTNQASLRSAFLCLKLQPAALAPSTSMSVILAPLQTVLQPRAYSALTATFRAPRRGHARSKTSLSSHQLRFASASTISTPPPAPSKQHLASRKTPALEPATTTHPATSAESTPSGTIPTSDLPDPTTSYAAPIASIPNQKQPLTWNAFLRLRRIRRRYNLISSIALASATTAGGAFVIGDESRSMETFNIMGIDPIFVMGFATLACGAVGWLAGPVVGSGIFGIVYRRLGPEMAAKEKDLFQRIKKQRVDPSNSSSSNPVPDYYGEKIGSVGQYRTWLKDQKAYNRRKQKDFV
ncbi:uncharacterized protein KY384_008919 [Bacidia gigantensis]|uniref:uncharacterized protein n=1 Tax=Bacidia gigantensis TaxID=2732470 RepID=UPI001D036306|nr:uncharacterized protein KY384_008919 [Bacidia gigantensis]KAG8525275.1 hypothetical protein KY384_008919 [Bacidia gigantensis]